MIETWVELFTQPRGCQELSFFVERAIQGLCILGLLPWQNSFPMIALPIVFTGLIIEKVPCLLGQYHEIYLVYISLK